jgi:hypothetical protein
MASQSFATIIAGSVAPHVPEEGGEPLRLYGVLDAAQDPSVGRHLEGIAFEVRVLSRAGRQGPMLALLESSEKTLDWLFDVAADRRMFIIVVSRLGIDELAAHLRRVGAFRLHDGRIVSFRYYDPAALVTQMLALSAEQRLAFFKGMESVFAEIGDTLARLRCTPDGSIDWTRYDRGNAKEIEVGRWRTPEFDLSGSATAPMLTLNKRQYEAPILASMPAMVEDCEAYLRDDFEARMKLFPPGILRAMIEMGIVFAIRDYRFDDLVAIRQFVDLQWRVAPGFHRQPQIHALLTDMTLSPQARMEALSEPAYTDAIADAFDFDDVREWGVPLPFDAPSKPGRR